MVKVSESWKQFMASWILPKDKQKISTWGIRVLLGHFFLFILGRVEDTIFCFTDLLTFTIIEEINSSNKEQRIFKEFCPLQMVNILLYRLDGRKGAVFLGQGPVQGPREEVQGPCARATNPVNRNGCKGHLDMCKGHKKRCKGLWCVQGPLRINNVIRCKGHN